MRSTHWSYSSYETDDDDYKKWTMPQWMIDLEKAFPLPLPATHQCRDVFLKQFLEPYRAETETMTEETETESDTDESLLAGKVHFGGLKDMSATHARLMNTMIKIVRKSVYARLSVSSAGRKSISSRVGQVDLNKLLKERYDNIASAIGVVSVLYTLQDLKYCLLVVREMWSMSSNVDRTLRMFSWSIDDYITRFHLPNNLYLDAVDYELKNTMDCFKFRMDLKETLRLVDALVMDIKTRRDVCNFSMLVIRDAEKDIMELLTNSQKEAAAQHYQITLATHRTPHSADPSGARYKALQTKINNMDFHSPIEARYVINWNETLLQQGILRNELKVKDISDELDLYHRNNMELHYFWRVCSEAYEMEISSYKRRIHDMEVLYEKSMELVENEIQVTRNKLLKAIDDLKFHQDKVPVFHKKIAEIQEIIAKKEAAHNAEHRLTARKSGRQSKDKKTEAAPAAAPAKKKK